MPAVRQESASRLRVSRVYIGKVGLDQSIWLRRTSYSENHSLMGARIFKPGDLVILDVEFGLNKERYMRNGLEFGTTYEVFASKVGYVVLKDQTDSTRYTAKRFKLVGDKYFQNLSVLREIL